MEQYVIKGGNPLVGEVEIGGAKNAALAILSAAIMTDETILIENLPDVRDINVLLEAIAGIGAQVERIDRSTVKINGSTINDISVDYEYIKKIRASYYLLGALLGKYKHAELPSTLMHAPILESSSAYLKRFSKILSVTILVPSASARVTAICGCISVGYPG